MYKVVIVGFGSIGFRHFEAINKIKSSNIKLFIIDKKIKSLLKKYNLEKRAINTSNNFKSIPKKINLCIV